MFYTAIILTLLILWFGEKNVPRKNNVEVTDKN